MGVQISQCCSSKKNAINEDTLKKKPKRMEPQKQVTIQNRENSSKSNQSSAKAATNAQINEIPQEQTRSIQDKHIGIAEDLLSKKMLLEEQVQNNEGKIDRLSQSSRGKDEIHQNLSDIDEQRDQIDDFNRGLIFAEEVNNQKEASVQENQQKQQTKLMELDQMKIKSNNYRNNYEGFQVNVLDGFISGQKELKEFDEEESNSDNEEDENNKGQSNKKNGGTYIEHQENEGKEEDPDHDGQDDDEDEEDEEDISDDESYDLFDSGGVLQRIMKENRKKKNTLGIDQHSGQTYILKQYSPEDVKELDFDSDIAQRLKMIQIQHTCFCMTHAIRKQSDEGLLIVQNHEKGGSLSLFLDTAFSEKEAKVWIIKILKALQILHENKLVHGNLKPNNILLGQGQLKLTDINIFKNKKHLHSLYSAPELLQRDQLTEKSDIWSASLIFIEMITGVMPFLEKDREMTVEKLKEKIERMELRLHFNQDTQDFIKMMYNIDPNKRKTAKELLTSRYLISENQNFEKNYLTQLEKKKTKMLSQTKNFDSLNMSKQIDQQQMHRSSNYLDGLAASHKPTFNKGTTINIDKINNKQYGMTSVLTVVNIKERDFQQQESYLPISVANLMTTQLTNNNGFSQLIPSKDDSSVNVPAPPKPEVIPKNNDYLKQFSIQQQEHNTLSTAVTNSNTLTSGIEQDEERQKFQSKQEKYQQLIQQFADKQEEEEESDDDYESEEDEDDDNANDENSQQIKSNKKNKDHANGSHQNKLADAQDQDQDALRQKQLQIEQQLLDILNQELEGDGNSFASNASQELQSSFVGAFNNKNALPEITLAQSHKIPQSNMKFGNKAPLEKSLVPPVQKEMRSQEAGFYKIQEFDDNNQQQSIQLYSPHNQVMKTQQSRIADHLVDEMNRILNEGASVFSHESFEDMKRQISTQNFVGLKKMLTISSHQKTSNSIKTQKTLQNSQVNNKQVKRKSENVSKEDELKKSTRFQEEDECYYLDDYVQQKYPNEKKSKRNHKKSKDKDSQNKSNSQINNYTQNSDIRSKNPQDDTEEDKEMQRIQQQYALEQKLLDILNQNGDGDGSASFIQQGSQDLDRSFEKGVKDNNRASWNEVPLFVSNNIIKKQSNNNLQSNNSLSQQKLKSQGTQANKTPEQIVDEMNRILNEGASVFSIDSYEEIKRQISTQNFNGLRRTLTMNQQKTLNSIKTQKTLCGSQVINKNNNQTKMKLDLPVQESF